MQQARSITLLGGTRPLRHSPNQRTGKGESQREKKRSSGVHRIIRGGKLSARFPRVLGGKDDHVSGGSKGKKGREGNLSKYNWEGLSLQGGRIY